MQRLARRQVALSLRGMTQEEKIRTLRRAIASILREAAKLEVDDPGLREALDDATDAYHSTAGE